MQAGLRLITLEQHDHLQNTFPYIAWQVLHAVVLVAMQQGQFF